MRDPMKDQFRKTERVPAQLRSGRDPSCLGGHRHDGDKIASDFYAP